MITGQIRNEKDMGKKPDIDVFSEVLDLIAAAKAERLKRNYKCIEFANKAVSIAIKNNLSFQAAEATLEIASYYLIVLKDYDAALRHALNAHSLLNDESQPFLSANIYKLIGICYHWTGNFTNAVSNYLQAAKILEAEVLQTKEELQLAASLHFNIILIYSHLPFDEDKFMHLQKAIEFNERTFNKDGLAKCYSVYADYHPDVKNNPAEFKAYFEKSRQLFVESGNTIGEQSCLCPIGLAYCRLGDSDMGMRFLNEGLEAMVATNEPSFIASAHAFYAKAFRVLKNYEQAIEHYILVEELLMKNKKEVELQDLYESMAGTLAESGDFKSAYDYRLKYGNAKREWMSFDKATALHNATIRFAIDKEAREAQLQQQKNEHVFEYVHQLELSNNELKQLAYVAAHDLREPLRMMNSYTRLLEQHLKPELSSDIFLYIRTINESAKRMFEMIQDMMALSQANADVNLQDVNVELLLTEVLHVLEVVVKHRKASVVWNVQPSIKTDKTLLFQVFQNLISNGIKYNTNEKPVVEITYKAEPGKHIFEVHDNGIGIPEAQREKVFFIFQRLHKQEDYSGSGIGLAVCKKAIEKLKGRIWIEDSALGGTCIKFTLPDLSIIT
jgi:signal transduction histidine kinase